MLKLRAFNSVTKQWRWIYAKDIKESYTLILTASEIAARWSNTVEGAYMEWPSIKPNLRILSFAVKENSLDPSVSAKDRIYASLPDSDSDTVDANCETLAVIINSPTPGLYRSPDQLPDPVSPESGLRAFRILEGNSGYTLLQSEDGPPVSGEITLDLYVL